MPIETRKKKNPTPGAKKNLKTSARAAKVRKVTKKSLIMKVPPPSNTNPDKAPVLENTNPMPNTTQDSVPMTPNTTADSTDITPSFAQTVRFNPYERPIEFSDFEAKYGILSPDNLGMNRVSFGESLKAYEEVIPLDFKGTSLHGSKHERVREALLNEFIDFIMGQCPWLTSALKQMVSAPDGTHEVPAVIWHLGGDVTMEKRRMASALLFGFLSLKKPKKRAYAPIFNPLLS